MNPDAPSGVRLSQDQIRIVEFAIKEAIMEEVDGRLANATSGGDETGELKARLDAVERQAAEKAAPLTISKVPSPAFLGGAALAVVALAAATVFLMVPARVDSAVSARSETVAEMAQQVEAAHGSLTANADRSDSLTALIELRAQELELTAGSAAFRSEVAQMLKNDSEFLRLSSGPPGPPGPTGEPPAGVRYAPGAAFFESGGVALASLGRSSQGGGHAQVHNQAGGRVGFLGASPSGDGLFHVNNGREQATADIRTGADSSALTLQNGSALAYLATPNRGTAQLTVSNRNGDGGVTIRSRDGLGAILVNGRTAHDLAEVFDLALRDGVEPGTVLSVVDETGLGLSSGAYDRRVVGVVSGAGGYVPGMVLGTRDDGSSDLPVAINGQVFVKAVLDGGEIEPGDLLVASAIPGRAMRGSDSSRLTGAVIGKALEPFRAGDGDGLVKMLVMTR